MRSVKPDDEAMSGAATQPETMGNRQRMFFAADVFDPAPKNDVVSMEYPIFAL